MIVEIAGASPQRTLARQPGTTAGQAAARRPVTIGSRPGGPDLQPPLRGPTPQALVRAPPRDSGPGARRGGPRTT